MTSHNSGASSNGAPEGVERLLRLERALSEEGFGVSQALSLILTCLVTFTSGLEIYMLSLIGLDMQCYWHITPAEAATLFTVVFLGKCAGEPIWGAASDSFGRRPVILLLCLLTAAAATASAFAPSYLWFGALRFVFGFALPVDNIAIVWLLEILPPKQRGTMGSALGLCWVFASMASIAAASWLLEEFGWQLLVSVAAVPAVLSAALALAMPESPLWLAATGRMQSAEEELQRLSELNRLGVLRYICSPRRRSRPVAVPHSSHLEDPLLRPPQQQGEEEAEGEEGERRRRQQGRSGQGPGETERRLSSRRLSDHLVHQQSSSSQMAASERPRHGAVAAVVLPWKDLSGDWLKLALSLAMTGLMGVGQSSGNLLPQQAAAVHGGGGGGDHNGLSCTGAEEGSHLMLSQAAYRGLLLDSTGGLPGLFLGMAMIDAFGRLTTLSLMQVFAFVTWLPLLFMEDAGAGTFWLTGLVFVVQWFYTASLTVNNVWQVEVFPTRARSLGVALNGIMANLGNVVSPYMTAILVQDLESPRLVVAALQAMAAVSAGLVGAAMLRGLETSRVSSCLPATGTRLYRAMSLTPSMSSAPHCIFDDPGSGGEQEDGGAVGGDEGEPRVDEQRQRQAV